MSLMIRRFFTNNEKYNDFFPNIGDTFVDGINSFFMNKDVASENYAIPSSMSFYDFMNLVYAIYNKATSKQPLASVNDIMNKLKNDDFNSFAYNGSNQILYQMYKEEPCITYLWMEDKVLEAALWSTYIYLELQALLGDNKQKKISSKGEEVIKKFLIKLSGLSEKKFERSNFLWVNKDNMVQTIMDELEKDTLLPDEEHENTGNSSDVYIETKLRVRIEFCLKTMGVTNVATFPNKRVLSRLLAIILNDSDNTIYTTLFRHIKGNKELVGLSNTNHGSDIANLNKAIDECGLPDLAKFKLNIE